MDIENRRFLIVGAGRTGMATAKALKKLGANIIVSDKKTEQELQEQVEQFKKLQIPYEFGEHNVNTFLRADKIIVSPGVPLDLSVINKAKDYGIEVIGELELAYRLNSGIRLISITGTNGKSTTTELTGKILNAQYPKTFVGGNLGTPLITEIREMVKGSFAVIEISSFQIESLNKYSSEISVILNITPDHLDRYTNFVQYLKAKLRLIEHTKDSGTLILNIDDTNLAAIGSEKKMKRIYISIERTDIEGAFLKENKIFIKLNGKETEFVDLSHLKLKGLHNLYNFMTGILIGYLCKVEPELILKQVTEFRGLPHRMEHVLKVEGREFINDSKSTNPDSVRWALNSFEKVILILGGLNKGLDFTPLKELILKKVKLLILMGEVRDELKTVFNGLVNMHQVQDLNAAVRYSFENSVSGDIILFSPGCASFDMFKNYKERGDIFKKEVKTLKDAR